MKGGPGRRRRRAAPLVFLFDVDNTLLDNDRVTADLHRYIRRELGARRQARYWTLFKTLRAQVGYADYLGALQRYRKEYPHDPHILKVSCYLLDYPFADRVLPRVRPVIRHCRRWGRVVIVSDGDAVFQPHKIERSGLAQSAQGHVLVFVHKERELRTIERLYPGRHYVAVDDKPHILAAIKAKWRDRVTTIFVEQGHYALDRRLRRYVGRADRKVRRIGELSNMNFSDFATARPPARCTRR